MKKCIVSVMVLVLIGLTQASLIDDFESYNLGKVDDVASPPWDGITEGTSMATIREEAANGNQYINASHFTTKDNEGSRGFKNTQVGITEGDTKTLFFRVNAFSGNAVDHHIGLCDSTTALDLTSDWGNLSSMTTRMGIKTAASGTEAEIFWRSATGTSYLTQTAALDTWYNVWLVYYTGTDTADMYVNTGLDDATSAGTLSVTGQTFYKGGGTSGDLIQLAAIAFRSTGNVGFDDFYMADGVDLSNPIPEPATMVLLGLGGLLLRKRR